jgi:hypothetical protein
MSGRLEMTITNQNLKIYRGDNAQLRVTLTTADGNAYVPAPDDQIKYRIARNADSPTDEAFVTKEYNAGITVLNGVATIEITKEDTLALLPGLYHHELKIVDPPLEVATAMVGTVIVRRALDMGITP